MASLGPKNGIQEAMFGGFPPGVKAERISPLTPLGKSTGLHGPLGPWTKPFSDRDMNR